MPDPSKSPQFLDDCLHLGLRGLSQGAVAAIEKDEDKLFRILGGWRPAQVHRVIGNAYCDVVLENPDGDGADALAPFTDKKEARGCIFDLMVKMVMEG